MSLIGYPVKGYVGYYLTAKSLDAMWEHITQEELDLLKIDGANSYELPFKTQFEQYYLDLPLAVQDKEWAKVRFLMIWEDNRWLLTQIKEYKKKIEILSNAEMWKDETITTNAFKGVSDGTSAAGNVTINDSTSENLTTGTDSTTQNTKTINIANAGSTDGNSQLTRIEEINKTNIPDINNLNPEENNTMGINVLAATLSQTKNYVGNKDDFTITKNTNLNVKNKSNTISGTTTTTNANSLNTGYNKTTSSNDSKDAIGFLSLEIPQLRKKFLKKFAILFKY